MHSRPASNAAEGQQYQQQLGPASIAQLEWLAENKRHPEPEHSLCLGDLHIDGYSHFAFACRIIQITMTECQAGCPKRGYT